jgi:hypothetical protein
MSAWEGSSWQEVAEAKEARERAQKAITATPSQVIVVRPRTLATVAAELEAEMRAAKAGKAAAEKIPGLRAELEALLNGTEAP